MGTGRKAKGPQRFHIEGVNNVIGREMSGGSEQTAEQHLSPRRIQSDV